MIWDHQIKGVKDMNDFLTLEEFAQKLGVCHVTARKVLTGGEGPAFVRAGRRYLVPVRAYQEWARIAA